MLSGESVGHLFSGLEGVLRPSKMSDGECNGDGDSAIVAYEATRREKTNVLVGCEVRLKCRNCRNFRSQSRIQQISSVDPPHKQTTIV